jgi:glycosyltransferase involved in cell wall biosynthesis
MLAIFESHPVQYRAPVYQELQRLIPGSFHVIYGTDISMRKNGGVGFGKTATWDVPLLDGYPHTILDQERGNSLENFRSLRGSGLSQVFAIHRPKAILQTQFLYEYDFVALFQARIRRIPVWIRLETQDEAVHRSPGKNLLRSAVYRLLYSQVQKGFYIGELNREHLRKHGFPPDRLIRAPYCTVDRFQNASEAEFAGIRAAFRSRLGIGPDKLVIGFFGKLIPKKNPDLLMQAIPFMREELKGKVTLLYVGSGELEAEMRESVWQLEKSGVHSIFAGFINQSAIRDYYAATDIMVLPSRYNGETWGLVVNEALQAGCAVVVSQAVGCSREFGAWERVRTIPIEDAPALARAVESLAVFPRQFSWARERMKAYTTLAAAQALAGEIQLILNQS